MKKLLLLFLFLCFSCESNYNSNCDCNKVTKIISRTDFPDGTWSGEVEAKNECSGVIDTLGYYNITPKIGYCLSK